MITIAVLPSPSRIKNACDKITDSCVGSKLRASLLNKNKRYSFKESYSSRHGRLGYMIFTKKSLYKIWLEPVL